MRTRVELENAINGSPLFSIDRDKNAELFAAEEKRFLNDLAKLMSMIRNDFTEIGFEIIQTAKACAKAYKTECGVFLNYFNAALKKTLRVTEAKDRADRLRGWMTLDEKTELTIRKILKFADKRGDDIYSEEFQEKCAVALGVSLEIVEDAVNINYNIVTQSGNKTITNKDGDENELFGLIAAKVETAEDAIANFDRVREIMTSINTVFKEEEELVKPRLKKLLTIRLIEALESISIIEKIAQELDFFDDDIYSNYKINGNIPTARDIAKEFGVSESRTSTIIKTFLGKVPRKC